MTSHLNPIPPARRAVRIFSALAALTTTLSIISALLLSFHAASPDVWLAQTPELLELAADCDRLTLRDAQVRCKQRIVASRLARDRQAVQLAER